MRFFILFFLFISLPEAQNIKHLINYSVKKHTSLESIKYRLDSMNQRIKKSRNWSNPDLSLTINDIQPKRPFSRDDERMQYQSVSFKQKFPWFDKLETRETLAIQEKNVLLHSLKSAQNQLAYNIRKSAYTIKEIQARIGILKKYIRLSKQNIKLYTDYISTDPMSHSDSVVAELSLSKLQIRHEKYKALLKVQKEKLNYLVQKRVGNISDKLRIKKPKSLKYYIKGIKNNPTYHQKLALSDVATQNQLLTDLEKNPDSYVQIGYANRSEYPDFISLSVGISLPLYGTEELNAEIAQKEALARKSESIDYKALLHSEINEYYAKLMEAYNIYEIITQKSLPQLKHKLELSASAIEEGANLLEYTNTLEQQLALEEERIAVIATFLRTEAKLKSLIGE